MSIGLTYTVVGAMVIVMNYTLQVTGDQRLPGQ